ESEEAEKIILSEENSPRIFAPSQTDEWISAFIDGTYRIVRIGTYWGVPIFIGNIAASLVERDILTKQLKEKGTRTSFIVIFFPFKAFCNYFSNKSDEAVKRVQEFKNYLENEELYHALSDVKILKGQINIEDIRSKTVWFYSDITFRGRNENDILIKGDDIFNESKLITRVKTRIRVLMAALETLNLKFYKDELHEKVGWIMMDGALNNFYKYFSADRNQSERFSQYFNNVIGFIKTIRRYPANLDKSLLYRLGQDKFVLATSTESDDEKAVLEEMDEKSLRGQNKWGFIYLRFRVPFGYPKDAPFHKGLIKLQFKVRNPDSEEEIIKTAQKIVGMILKERFPVPKDLRRVWKECVAIEEAEKIAKSRLFSKKWLRNLGYIL
ncbi:hypothetical protein, partial [Thermotoga sp.]|uniref:hypothetical protein n=1 Tax=Thermotoga sp. TaxID=28240 RepID=UPI0025EE1FA4